MLDFFARLHLLLLHLPIGILGLAVVLELVSRWKYRPDWQPAVRLMLSVGMVAAVLTAFCGWLLAGRGDYDPVLLKSHKWWGFGVAALSVAVWWLQQTRWYFPGILACGAALAVTGHFGGALTHGADYLTEPFTRPSQAKIEEGILAPKPDAVVYQALIQPILQKKCVSCHNAGKSKGRLLLDTPENITKGGEHGAVLMAGKPEKSPLYLRATLPMADEHHMPPSGKVQLSDDELTLLKWWIAQGADFRKKMAATQVSPEVQAVFDRGKNKVALNPVFAQEMAAAEADDVQKVRDAGISVMALGAESPWLSVSFAGKKDLTFDQLKTLKNIRPQVTYLDAANSVLSDVGLKWLADFPNISKLNVAGTQITDEGLQSVAAFSFLETLNLSETRATDAGLALLAPLKHLRVIHVWKSDVSEIGLEALVAGNPKLKYNLGSPADTTTDLMPLRMPKILYARSIFSDTMQVSIDFPFKNVDVYYDFDEASPTTQSPKYEDKPIVLEKTTKIRTFAARKGWGNSPIAEATFVKRLYTPVSATLLNPPSEKYPGNGALSLYDGVIAPTHNDKAYLGFEGQHLHAVLDFGKPIDFHRLSVHCVENNNSWVFLPRGIKVWTSMDGKKWESSIAAQYPVNASMQETKTHVLSNSATVPKKARYLKVQVENLLVNPPWHPGKGQKSWVFVDEIMVE